MLAFVRGCYSAYSLFAPTHRFVRSAAAVCEFIRRVIIAVHSDAVTRAYYAVQVVRMVKNAGRFNYGLVS